tara:strand:- start:3124 stop:5076 length:1953 start_codon:yes stop_codon:yes gene_type:complete
MAITLPNDTIANTFRTVTVDTNGDGTADNTLGGTETLMIKKGNDITLAESDGVVTITNSSPHVATNLTQTNAASTLSILSSTGTNVLIVEADGTKAGVMTVAHHNKLDSIEASATADQTAAEITALLDDVASYTLGTVGSGTITIANDLVVTGTTTTNNVETVSTSNGVVFESNATGSHVDKETLLTGVTGLTSDITVTLPSTTGTLALSGASVNYSQLTGTVPTWNQDTSGTAAGLSSTLAVSSGGTGVTSVPMVGLITAANVAAVKTILSYGNLAALDSVGASQITDNSVGAAELNVSGNGTNGYVLSSDGDGSFSWTAQSATGIALTALSANDGSASGSGGSLAYNNTNGEFTFTPALNIAGNSATSTVTANNSTDENNYLTFAANATASGSLGLETDSTLYFNPSQDKLYVPYVSATNLTASNLISAVNGINITGNSQGINLSGTSNFVKTDNLKNDTLLAISTTANNANITLNPHGTGQIAEKGLKTKTGTYVETRHPDTGTPAANNATYAQTHGITKVQGSQSQFGVIANGSAITVTGILPNGSVTGGSSGYRAVRGTIHIDAGLTSSNIVMTQDFIANANDGSGGFTFTSYGMVFDGQTDPPFKIAWDDIGTNDLALKVINNMGTSTTNTLRIWWDLTLFPQV